jgi:hypothetical protein
MEIAFSKMLQFLSRAKLMTVKYSKKHIRDGTLHLRRLRYLGRNYEWCGNPFVFSRRGERSAKVIAHLLSYYYLTLIYWQD